MKKAMTAAVLGGSFIFLQAACGGGAGGPAAPSQGPAPQGLPSLGPADPALAGRWVGTLNGSFGPGDMTMVLQADGRTSFEGSGNYCRVDGDWGVAGAEFTARGSDCTGTIVTLVAPASSASLAGNWSASSGRHGTFSLTRQ